VYAGVGGWSATSSADQFTYIVPPSVNGISPGSGAYTGGTQVTISGAGFNPQVVVTFGNVPATSVTINSQYTITATAPPGNPGTTVDVVVTGAGGQSATTAADHFAYSALSSAGARRTRASP
jgi:hypothetical protein